MKEYSIKSAADFWNDLDSALNYIAYEKVNPSAARKLYDKVIAKIETLKFAPRINLIKDDLYSTKVGHYKIIYQVIDSGSIVKLLHFWYARRDIRKLLDI